MVTIGIQLPVEYPRHKVPTFRLAVLGFRT